MIDTPAWLAVGVAVASIVAALRDPRGWRIDGRSIVGGVYLSMVLPKIVLYHIHGDAVFLSREVVSFPPSAVNAAVVLVGALVVSVNVVYLLTERWTPEISPKAGIAGGSRSARDYGPSEWAVLLSISGVSVAALLIMDATLGPGGHEAFAKVDFGPAPRESTAYWMQKLAQVAKAGMIFGILALFVSGRRPRTLVVIAWFATLTIWVYLHTGQRIGVALTLLQLLLVLQILGRLHARTLLIAAGCLVASSLLVVAARDTPEATSFVYLDQIVRRYFFEIEKLTGVLSASASGYPFADGSWRVLVDGARPPFWSFDLDGFLGGQVLGSRSAVPPSFPGEVVFFVGGLAMVPAGLLLGLFFRGLERFVYGPTGRFEWRVAGAWMLATAYLLLLNSDASAFLLRLLLELAIFLVAVCAFRATRRNRGGVGRSGVDG